MLEKYLATFKILGSFVNGTILLQLTCNLNSTKAVKTFPPFVANRCLQFAYINCIVISTFGSSSHFSIMHAHCLCLALQRTAVVQNFQTIAVPGVSAVFMQ